MMDDDKKGEVPGMKNKEVEKVEKREVPEMSNEDVEKVEKILGYHFKDPGLLEEALTHSSFYCPFRPEVSYERLEFVGDAVLNCLIGRWVFSMFPDLAPGPLTRLRAVNVDTEKLARVAVSCDLHLYIRHKASQLNKQIQDFMEGMKEYPNHSHGLLDPPKALADIVESILGAIFVDSNSSLETVWKTFRRLAEPLIDLEKMGKNPTAELHELCQKKKLKLNFEKGAWEKTMNIDVLIDGKMVGSATYGKKDIAMNRAAKSALDRLKLGIMDPMNHETPELPSSARHNHLSRLWTYSTLFVFSLLTAVVLRHH